MMATASVAPTAPDNRAPTFSARLRRAVLGEARLSLVVYPMLGLAGIAAAVVAEDVRPGLISFLMPMIPPEPTNVVPAPPVVSLIEPDKTVIAIQLPAPTLDDEEYWKAINADNLQNLRQPQSTNKPPEKNNDSHSASGRLVVNSPTGQGSIVIRNDDLYRFQNFINENYKSQSYNKKLDVGEEVSSDVKYREVPKQYNTLYGFRYAILNNITVFLDKSNKIVFTTSHQY